MPEESGRAKSDGGVEVTAGTEDISEILPLDLIRSQVIPPAPNRRQSAIDWLHDFAGFSWIAYGASSLLVISHCPSPLPPEETEVGPFFQQVIEPPRAAGDGSSIVNAVAWCPSRPSGGEIASSSGNHIRVYLPESRNGPGSFCWRQTVGLVHSFAVEVIEWTGSGDGLIAAGIETVFWKRKNTSWEIAWKSRSEVPQTLVSATWSIDGPVATAAHVPVYSSGEKVEQSSSLSRDASQCVLVCQDGGKSGFMKVELNHPQSVTMIQWRPSTVTRSINDPLHLRRDVLLTCCLDGAVRLWSEIDSGRVKKSFKEMNDQKATRRSFHVTAVIEMNQCMTGTLGTDIFIAWATEIGGEISKGKRTDHCFSNRGSDYDEVGRCEWLIGVGPGWSLTFWAIHCLDDISPLRFPRVNLWKKQNLMDLKVDNICSSTLTNSKNQPILIKVVVSRTRLFGPPVVCSLLQLLPDNSVSWSQLYSPESISAEDGSLCQPSKEKSLSCFARGFLSQDGHTGVILQVSVHPCSCEVELAVSLDSNGLLLFWSISTISNCALVIQTMINPTWNLLGRVVAQDLSAGVAYSTLTWAPSILSENRFLLLGHAEGIDCLLIQISDGVGQRILCHKIFSLPFAGNGLGDGPDHIFVIPLASTCRQSFVFNNFMLSGIWMKEFRALSWEIVMHSDDLSGSYCECRSEIRHFAVSETWKYESSFAGLKYYITANLCSSKFPDSHICAQVTSVAAVCPDNLIPSVQLVLASSKDLCCNAPLYHMATGCSDGSLTLWRISRAESSILHSDMNDVFWECVGMLNAHEGPVSGIALSSCGSKIATVSVGGPNSGSNLHIWESVCLKGGGNFLLEDKISLDGAVVAFNWLALGNGQLLLGVCMPNELRIYSQRRSDDPIPLKSGTLLGMQIWLCIAVCHTYATAQGFLWGPKVTPVLVHERHFSLFSQWSFRTDIQAQAKFHLECNEDHSAIRVGEADGDFLCIIHTDTDPSDISESLMNARSEACEFVLPATSNTVIDCDVHKSCKLRSQLQHNSDTKSGLHSMLKIANRLRGPLPAYHPKALLLHLCSGNWKRTYVVVQHLVGSLNSNGTSANILKTSKPGKSCFMIPEIHLAKYFEENSSTIECNKGLQWGHDVAMKASTMQFQQNFVQDAESNHVANFPQNVLSTTSRKSETMGFTDILEKSDSIAAMTDIERTQILAIVDLLGEVSNPHNSSAYESFDEPGRRFWVAVRFQRLCFLRIFGRLAAAEELVVDSWMIAWAFQSEFQENLFGSLLSTESSWLEMRNLGVGFWYRNTTQLRPMMEKLARSQYLRKKDPKDCALLYLALNRLQVLAGLFKISKVEKDKPLVGFLSRNFQEEKNKAAALKNAYVLMGRHQLELAIAFFLLGGDPSSAVTVCAKNLGDEQLALVICRLIEGYGGPLERNLISNFLLPTAIEKRDYWLSSLLEWMLGNYTESFMNLLGSHMDSENYMSDILCNRPAFSDPNIGQYCATLASKNSMRNTVGDYMSAVLSKWATLTTVIALNRCGLPLEAMECLSSSSNTFDGKDHGNSFDIERHRILHGILNPFSSNGCNWLLGDVACHLESILNLNLAMQYLSKLVMEHPSWPDVDLVSSRMLVGLREHYTSQDELQMEKFEFNVNMGLSIFEQKCSLKSVDMITMIFVSAHNNGVLFLGYHILHGYISREYEDNKHHTVYSSLLYPALPRLLVKASKEVSYFLARCTLFSSITVSASDLTLSRRYAFGRDNYGQHHPQNFCLENIIYSLRSLRPILKVYSPGLLTAELSVKTFAVLDLFELCLYFASAWFQRNVKGLIMIIQPILNAFGNEQSVFETIGDNLRNFLSRTSELMVQDALSDGMGNFSAVNCKQGQLEENGSETLPISEDDKWQLIGTCLWRHLFNFSEHLLSLLVAERIQDENSNVDLIKLFPILSTKLLITSLAYVSSSFTKQLASFMKRKAEKGLPVPTPVWLEESIQSGPKAINYSLSQGIDTMQLPKNENQETLFKILWDISFSPKEVCGSFIQETVNYVPFSNQNFSGCWNDIQKIILADSENIDTINYDQEGRFSSNNEAESLSRSRIVDRESFFGTKRKDKSPFREVSYFRSPKEVYKKNGELLEAICFNSINEQQVALASNRRGLLFFDCKVEEPLREQAEYIWSESDWPLDGWAGSESTPIPTFVSPGIGLGSRKGAHLGLGGATIGLGSLARPGRDLTGGGAFGIPGYAGIGASGLGWGEQEDFEEFIDPPATVENIRTRALSSHPSKPFFLVGSSNTHVYLWEFGKDRATATYGILPAANVPPPYALASVSALKFEHCGQRFATAALDGTVCTWQLEVGGRSNVYPTESSLCFNNHASDIAYLSSSGSILATAGCSTHGVNVVLWDTLAPPATSQASLTCHEGGARSIAVFDNDIGSGSISPMIISGGKSGDVGVHDFRFIATGRTKRHRYLSEQNLKSSAMHDINSGTSNKFGENANGMLWHIPKAHLGSVTRISTIPNTSLFLTGSKDGDVKLWDAKRSELVFHWQKLHEKHTFLQPSSRGFNGVVRAAVTDVQVLSDGFLTCGGDGTVKLVRLQDFPRRF